jgi:mono/diheme cytochrome c family protein
MRIMLAFLVFAAAAAGWFLLRAPEPEPGPEQVAGTAVEMLAVDVPALEGAEIVGKQVFAARCSECHGPNAGGIEGAGPPLIHKIYEPSHHGDMAFVLAATRGVRAHHWRFGDMPPVEGITQGEIGSVVAFIRKVQRANGIH